MGLWDHRCYFASKDGSPNGEGSETNPFDLKTLLASMGRCKMVIEISRSGDVPGSGYWYVTGDGVNSELIAWDDDPAGIETKLRGWCDNIAGLEFVSVSGGPYGIGLITLVVIAPYSEWELTVYESGMSPAGTPTVVHDPGVVKCKGVVKAGFYDPVDLGGLLCTLTGGNADRNEIAELIGYRESFDLVTEKGDLDGLSMLEGAAAVSLPDAMVVSGFLSEGGNLINNSELDQWLSDDPVDWIVSGEVGSNQVTEDPYGARMLSDGGYISLSHTVSDIGKFKIELQTSISSGKIRLKVRHLDGSIEDVSGIISSSGTTVVYCEDVQEVIVENASACDVVLSSCEVYKMDGPRGIYDWYESFDGGDAKGPGYYNGQRVYRSRSQFLCPDEIDRNWALWHEGYVGGYYIWRLTPETGIGLQSSDGWYWRGDADGYESMYFPVVKGPLQSSIGYATVTPAELHVGDLPVIDGWGNTTDIFDVAGEQIVGFRNLHFTNMDSIGEGHFLTSSTVGGVRAKGCAFTGAARVSGGGPLFSTMRFESCYFAAISKNMINNQQAESVNEVRGCLIRVRDGYNALRPMGTVLFERNIVTDASRVINIFGPADIVYIRDNTILGASTCVVDMWRDCKVIEEGNIIVDALCVYWWPEETSRGTLLKSENSCLFNSGYAISANPEVVLPCVPDSYVQTDPNLLGVVAQNRDVKVPYEMGAFKQGYKSIVRSRPVNLGRMSIVK
ncbi:hypothetical protein STSP2_00251 [Anaerohalosphaera lusitana]|uniref:Uncharacterized protein n=1 Tax=Anaerohalosphaera lusitana TaxID=1936003 RepID=A0A1U9NHN0_9BACT|nr:hypothetical protein [Anaerohalosphaera lusitana]AQT67110.1 hypothetical protein STSP2_00251 [Anaerohalosphaera lusitana]